MRQIDLAFAVLFTILGFVSFAGAFVNHFHFVTSSGCFILAYAFLTDKAYSDESVFDCIRRYYKKK